MSSATESKTVMVVGGSGFIGSTLVAQLLQKGFCVVLGDPIISDQSSVQPLVQQGDVEHRSMESVLAGTQLTSAELDSLFGDIDSIICLYYKWPPLRDLFRADPTPHNRVKLIEQERALNLEPVMALYRAATDARVRQFVFASTLQVHAIADGDAVSETSVVDPQYPYAVVKYETEEQLKILEERDAGPKVAIMRFSTVYGVGDRPPRAIPNFIERVNNGEPPLIEGDGNALSDYINVKDVASALIAAVQHNAVGDFIIGSGVGTSTKQIADCVIRIAGSTVIPEHVDERHAGLQASYYCDISKAQAELQWNPQVHIEEGIKEEWDWMTRRNSKEQLITDLKKLEQYLEIRKTQLENRLVSDDGLNVCSVDEQKSKKHRS